MNDLTIQCPKCTERIHLTESLAAPLLAATRRRHEEELAAKDSEVASRESELRERERRVRDQQAAIEEQIVARLQLERRAIADEEFKRARQAAAADLKARDSELAALQESLQSSNSRVVELSKAQVDLMRRERELVGERQALELSVEQRVRERLQKYDESFAAKDAEAERREAALRDQEQQLREWRAEAEKQIAEQLGTERVRIATEEGRRAKQQVTAEIATKDSELASLKESLELSAAKITELSKAQVDLIRRERELVAERESLELSVERRVSEQLDGVRSRARRDAEEELRFKISEKEQQISGMQRQIEELRRRAEQGSQQLQGEVLELELEKLLAAAFPPDRIEPVPKGEFGGDTLQRVIGPLGQTCGTILWESKRTKNWSDGWLQKLRDDQRVAKAELAVLVSSALPKGIETFGLMEGVWVTHPRAAVPVALVLRHALIEAALARKAGEGQQTKTELLYDYLVGPRFRQRVQAIVEAFSSMKEDLDKERRAISKQWAKREEQITRVMRSTVGMYGDLQGIAGASIQEIEGLSVAQLASGDPDGDLPDAP